MFVYFIALLFVHRSVCWPHAFFVSNMQMDFLLYMKVGTRNPFVFVAHNKGQILVFPLCFEV